MTRPKNCLNKIPPGHCGTDEGDKGFELVVCKLLCHDRPRHKFSSCKVVNNIDAEIWLIQTKTANEIDSPVISIFNNQ